MRTKFFIFRHGQTDWNAVGRYQGHTDISLNATGRQQASQLQSLLAYEQLDFIVSSDLKRALETAQIAVAQRPVPVRADHRLRECHMGDAEGLTESEVIEKWGASHLKIWRSWEAHHLHERFPNGESGAEVQQRLLMVLGDLARNHVGKKIGISTHGGAMRRILQKHAPEQQEKVGLIPNGALYLLEHWHDVSTVLQTSSPLGGRWVAHGFLNR